MSVLGSSASVAAPSASPPGEGVVCAWAIYAAMAEVGSRCFPQENPAFQAELAAGVSRIDAYVLANSPELDAAGVAAFKAQQGQKTAPTAQLCKGDAVMMYRMIEQRAGQIGLDAFRAELDKMIARPGKPTWGTCL